MKTLRGSCHCGSVGFRIEAVIDGATACNCTVCHRYGALWAYDYENEGIVVTGETKVYIRGKALEFHFCAQCGCVVCWRECRLDDGGRRRMAVNLRMCERTEVAEIPIDHFDGFDTFEDLPRDGKCVRDYWF